VPSSVLDVWPERSEVREAASRETDSKSERAHIACQESESEEAL